MSRQIRDGDDSPGHDFLRFWKRAAGLDDTPRAPIEATTAAPQRGPVAAPPSPPPRKAAPQASIQPAPTPITADARPTPTLANGSLVSIGCVGGHVIIVGDAAQLGAALQSPRPAAAA